jgi:hypothetical protein
VQKFPVKLTLENGKQIACSKDAIEKVSKRTDIEKLIKGRDKWECELNEWEH